MSERSRPVGRFVSGLIEDVVELLRQELRLLQAEAWEKTSQAIAAIVSITCGLLLAFSALLVLLQAVVLALSNVVQPWLASVIVGLTVALLGFILVHLGRKALKSATVMPERTMRSVKKDKQLVMESLQ